MPSPVSTNAQAAAPTGKTTVRQLLTFVKAPVLTRSVELPPLVVVAPPSPGLPQFCTR